MSARHLCLSLCLGIMSATGGAAAGPVPPRILSINMCTDQFLLDLAAPEQIVGLSPYAGDAARSYRADRIGSIPLLSGTAEEVMVLKPDLVVSSSFTKRATHDFIRARGIPLEEFPPALSLEETKRQILRFGALTGRQAQAAAQVAALDAARDALRRAAAETPLRVLPLARRGWVAGSGTLIGDLLKEAGLRHAAVGEAASHGRVSLEEIVQLKPDAILLTARATEAEDQGSALLQHQALRALFPPERQLVIPERLTVCGGPMLVEAMQTLADQIHRLKPRGFAR